jgi:hypothetical protein
MDFVSGLVVYLLLWWWIFLMSLPFGVRTADNPEAGHAASAPTRTLSMAQDCRQHRHCRHSVRRGQSGDFVGLDYAWPAIGLTHRVFGAAIMDRAIFTPSGRRQG